MRYLLVYFILAVMLIESGCDNDKKENPNPTFGFRLIGTTSTTEGSPEDDFIFTYDGDNIASWLGTYGGAEKYRTEVSYFNERTVEFLYYELNNDIYEHVRKLVYILDYDDNVTMIEGYDYEGTQLNLDFKATHLYNDDGNIIQSYYYDFEDGVEVLSGKRFFAYDGGLLIEQAYYQEEGGSLVPENKTTYQYNNDVLINSIESFYFINEWIESNKHEFIYDGNIVTQVLSYIESDIGSWELSSTTNYSYDDDGNMTVAEETPTSGYTFIESYRYEAKLGNLSLFGFADNYGYPNPVYNPKLQFPIHSLEY